MRALAAALCGSALAGCATMDRGSAATIRLVTTPTGANCTVTRGGGVLGTVAATPGAVTFGRGRGTLFIDCTKNGYIPVRAVEEPLASTQVVAPAGGLICLGSLVDDASGANYRYRPQIDLDLRRPGEPPRDGPQLPLSLNGLRLR